MFRSARLKLSIFFSASILLVVILFSLGVYIIFSRNAESDFEYQGSDSQQEAVLQQQVAEEDRRRLLITLMIVDSATVSLSIALGWFLAGKTLAPIQDAMNKQKQFVSNAAHELNTPLSVMKAGLETIEAGTGPTLTEYRELRTDLLEETNRLADLTDDLLFLSRSDSSFPAITRSQFDVSSVCTNSVGLLDTYARQKEVNLTHAIQPGLKMMGDENQFKRLILNLLKNAVDYNKEGGEAHLSLQPSGNEVILEISDTGIGIAQKDLPHIFDRFFKADSARERSTGGTGLGLSIVKEIVASHHGHINVESRQSEGTRIVAVFSRTCRKA